MLGPNYGYPIEDVIGWKVYYTDGSVECSKDKSWEEATQTEVQVVKLFFSKVTNAGYHYSMVLSGKDYYFKGPEGFGYSFDNASLVVGHSLYGKWTTYENYCDVLNKAVKDNDF